MSTGQSMGSRAASGALYMGVTQAVRMALTFLSAIVTARLLTPHEYGVAAMVAPVTGFLLIFQNLGLSQATVQAQNLTSAQSNSMFWINVGASILIAAALLVLAPIVGWFYDDARAAYYTAAIAGTVVVSGLALQHAALLSREMRFRAISIIDVTTATATFAATAGSAAFLRNYWALWVGVAVGAVVQTAMTWQSSRWRPTLPVTFRGAGGMLKFGGSLTGFNLLTFLGRNMDNVLIARVWGAEAVGLYDRGYKLMMYPLQNINFPLSRLMLPILSRLVAEPERYRRAYLHTVRGILLISVPGIAVAGATSEKLIPLLLGDRWTGVVPIFYWLSLCSLVQPLSHPAGWLFISSGRGKALFQWGIFSAVLSLAGFAIGVPWGPTGVALAYFVTQVLRLPILIWWSGRGSPVSQRDVYAITLPTYLAAGMVWGGLHLVLDQWSIWALLAVGLPTSYAISVALHAAFPAGREFLVSGSKIVAARLFRKRSIAG